MSDVDRETEIALLPQDDALMALTASESPSDTSDESDALRTPPGVSFTLTEASERCRVHRATIRRKLDDGAFPNAWREDDGAGPWRIPLRDLLAADLHPSALGSGPPDSDRTDERASDDQAELARLRVELQHTRELLQRADATIEMLGQAVRALSPAPVQPQLQTDPDPVASPRRRWWQR